MSGKRKSDIEVVKAEKRRKSTLPVFDLLPDPILDVIIGYFSQVIGKKDNHDVVEVKCWPSIRLTCKRFYTTSTNTSPIVKPETHHLCKNGYADTLKKKLDTHLRLHPDKEIDMCAHLTTACTWNQIEVVSVLLKHKISGIKNCDALIAATEKENAVIAKMLLQDKRIDPRHNDSKAIKLLWKEGKPINQDLFLFFFSDSRVNPFYGLVSFSSQLGILNKKKEWIKMMDETTRSMSKNFKEIINEWYKENSIKE